MSGLHLPLGHRLQAATNDLGDIGCGEENDCHLCADELVDSDAIGHEQRQHDRCHEQDADQRHAAHDLDEAHPRIRIAGRLEARASASAIPSGSAQASPIKESMKESGRPPHCVVGTTVRPKYPPAINT